MLLEYSRLYSALAIFFPNQSISRSKFKQLPVGSERTFLNAWNESEILTSQRCIFEIQGQKHVSKRLHKYETKEEPGTLWKGDSGFIGTCLVK